MYVSSLIDDFLNDAYVIPTKVHVLDVQTDTNEFHVSRM
jgi:hypothetical protein